MQMYCSCADDCFPSAAPSRGLGPLGVGCPKAIPHRFGLYYLQALLLRGRQALLHPADLPHLPGVNYIGGRGWCPEGG